jgi:hypothetical protein
MQDAYVAASPRKSRGDTRWVLPLIREPFEGFYPWLSVVLKLPKYSRQKSYRSRQGVQPPTDPTITLQNRGPLQRRPSCPMTNQLAYFESCRSACLCPAASRRGLRWPAHRGRPVPRLWAAGSQAACPTLGPNSKRKEGNAF